MDRIGDIELDPFFAKKLKEYEEDDIVKIANSGVYQQPKWLNLKFKTIINDLKAHKPSISDRQNRPPQNPILQVLKRRTFCPRWYFSFHFRYISQAETLVDKAVALKSIGGTYGGTRKPTKFICLLLKML